MKIKYGLCFCAFLLSLISIAACQPPPQQPVKVGTNQWLGYEPLYLARSLGYYDDKDIQLKELNSSTDVMLAFKQQQINVAALTLDEALQLAEDEKDLSIFLIMNISDGADKVMAHPAIASPKQLKGKRIVVENTALGAYMLHNLLQKAGLKSSDVEIIPANYNEHPTLMQQNKCDAAITFEPTASKLAFAGWHEIFNSREIAGKIIDVLVTRKSTLSEHQSTLKELANIQWKALQYIQQNPKDAYQKIAPRLGFSAAEVAQGYQEVKLPAQAQNQAMLAKNTELIEVVNEMSNVLFNAGLLKTPQTENLLTDEIVRQDG